MFTVCLLLSSHPYPPISMVSAFNFCRVLGLAPPTLVEVCIIVFTHAKHSFPAVLVRHPPQYSRRHAGRVHINTADHNGIRTQTSRYKLW